MWRWTAVVAHKAYSPIAQGISGPFGSAGGGGHDGGDGGGPAFGSVEREAANIGKAYQCLR